MTSGEPERDPLDDEEGFREIEVLEESQEDPVVAGAGGASLTANGGTGGVGVAGTIPPSGDGIWTDGLNGARRRLIGVVERVTQVIGRLWRGLLALPWGHINNPFSFAGFIWEFVERMVKITSEWVLLFPFLSIMFIWANHRLREQVRQGPDRSLWALLKIAIQVPVVLVLGYLFSRYLELTKALPLLPTRGDYWFWVEVLGDVFFVDLLAKLGTVLLKCLVASFPDSLLKFSERGEVYNLIELSSQLLRSLLPVRPWLTYFIFAYQSEGSSIISHSFGLLYSAIYILWKLGYDTRKRVENWLTVFKIVWMGPEVASKQAGSEAIAGLGEDMCPICQEDDYDKPIKLQCDHFFCDKCIRTWFKLLRDREQVEQCPLCRDNCGLDDKLDYRDGSTHKFTIFV